MILMSEMSCIQRINVCICALQPLEFRKTRFVVCFDAYADGVHHLRPSRV